MRIIGGRFKGRKLVAPEGPAVRPTSDRAREAVFNVLLHRFAGRGLTLPGAHVVDVFAGTGAMGLEALSHGAAQVTFIDNGAEAIRALRENIRAFGVLDRVSVLTVDATRPPAAVRPCGLAFLDPPYDTDLVAPVLSALLARGWLAPGALCVVERSRTAPPIEPPPGFEAIDARTYGKACITFVAAPGGNDAAETA